MYALSGFRTDSLWHPFFTKPRSRHPRLPDCQKTSDPERLALAASPLGGLLALAGQAAARGFAVSPKPRKHRTLDPFAYGAGFAVTAQPARPAVWQKHPRQQRWRGGLAAICLLCCTAAARPTPNRISPVLGCALPRSFGSMAPLGNAAAAEGNVVQGLERCPAGCRLRAPVPDLRPVPVGTAARRGINAVCALPCRTASRWRDPY